MCGFSFILRLPYFRAFWLLILFVVVFIGVSVIFGSTYSSSTAAHEIWKWRQDSYSEWLEPSFLYSKPHLKLPQVTDSQTGLAMTFVGDSVAPWGFV